MTSCPKPPKGPPKVRAFGNTTLPQRSAPIPRGGPIQKVGTSKAKRQARNAAYYKSAEWRAKKKAVHERDNYQCAEVLPVYAMATWDGSPSRQGGEMRCPNRGEIVNGKQTARGLVCEETSYGHRGREGRIDTCTTRCAHCDRRLTPLERINHRYGFRRVSGGGEGTPE